MGNAAKGQTSLNVDGVDFTLAFTANAMCELEEATGQSVPKFLAGLEDPKNPPGFTEIRLLLWAGLLDQHGMTLKEAGQLIDAVGLDAMGDKMATAMARSLPDPDAAPAGAGGAPGKKKRARRTT
jgi:hypothetical protein